MLLRLGLRAGQGHLMVHDIATIHFVRNRMKFDGPGISASSALNITPSQPVPPIAWHLQDSLKA